MIDEGATLKFCGSCGNQVIEAARFCPKCGISLAVPKEADFVATHTTRGTDDIRPTSTSGPSAAHANGAPELQPVSDFKNLPLASSVSGQIQIGTPQTRAPVPPPPRAARARRSRSMVIAAAVVALIAVVGFGGKIAWSATEVKRKCALQPTDVTTFLVPWTVSSVRVSYGTDQYPLVNCFYSSGQSGTQQDAVSVTHGSTESGEIPGKPEACLSGGYWQGRGYVCATFGLPTPGIEQVAKRSVQVSGTRLNGSNTYSGSVTCVENTVAVEPPSRDLQERCFSELVNLMGALTARLDVAPDARVSQTPPTLDAALAAAQLGAAPSDGPLPTTTEPEPGGEPNLPEPSASDIPTPIASPTDVGVDVVGETTFDHFGVAVTGTERLNGDATLVHVRVCLTSLTLDASNGKSRISWDPWSATSATGLVLRPKSATGVTGAFPRESRIAPGDCVSGDLVFNMPDIVSVTYKNGQGDEVTFP